MLLALTINVKIFYRTYCVCICVYVSMYESISKYFKGVLINHVLHFNFWYVKVIAS